MTYRSSFFLFTVDALVSENLEKMSGLPRTRSPLAQPPLEVLEKMSAAYVESSEKESFGGVFHWQVHLLKFQYCSMTFEIALRYIEN